MTREEFEQLVDEEFPNAIPEQFRSKIKNVAFLVEDEPSAELKKKEGLGSNETLLGFYQGIPATRRGDSYGLGATLPDTITLFQLPIEHEAQGREVRKIIRDTIWHEVAHHFGYDERQVRAKEAKRAKM